MRIFKIISAGAAGIFTSSLITPAAVYAMDPRVREAMNQQAIGAINTPTFQKFLLFGFSFLLLTGGAIAYKIFKKLEWIGG